MKRYLIFLLILMSTLIIGCSGNDDTNIVFPTSINVTNIKEQIKVGESFTLGVELLPADATDKTYEINVFPSGIVDVSNNTITGLKSGSVLITVRSTSENTLIYQFMLNVFEDSSHTGLDIDGLGKTIKINEEDSFKVYYDGKEVDEYDYIMIPDDIVEIQKNKIKGIKAGTAKIIFYPKGDYSDRLEFEVNVYDQDFEVLGLSKIIEINKTVDLSVLLKGTNISYEDYDVTISDDTVMNYSEGKITTLKSGKCEVNVALVDAPNINMNYVINVVESMKQVPTSIDVQGMPATMIVGGEVKLDVCFYPLDYSSQDFIIRTYPKDIVKVNGSTITAINEGEVLIFIESALDPDINLTCNLKVFQKAVNAEQEIIVEGVPDMISLFSSEEYFLKPQISYPYPSEYEIRISDNSIIQILDDGLIKPLKSGTVTVTITLPNYQHLYRTIRITVVEYIETCAHNPNLDKCLDPETWDWEYNRSGFDGKGMTIKILHDNPEEIDPYLSNFSGERKEAKMRQIYEIEKAYNINLSIERYPNEAQWGPDRVAWINNLAATNETTKGDIFTISSDWVPSLAKDYSISVLELVIMNKTTKQWDQDGGLFSHLNYTQSQEKIKQYMFSKKVYGYSIETAHADFFLYYNQALITKYSLEDPATLWNEGKWDWTTFYNFLETAQQAFDSAKTENDPQMYAFGGWINEVVRGALAARGGKFVDPETKKVLFNNATVIQMYDDLRSIKEAGMWAPKANDVCDEFMAGNQLFQPAKLWFLSSKMRFAPADETEEKMQISLVPYPTADGDAEAKASYTIPMESDVGYAIRNVTNEASGLTVTFLANILDDFCRGISPEFSVKNMTNEQIYRKFLTNRIDSVASIEAVMSVENKINQYGYTDYLDVISKSVGNGSDWQGDGFYTWGITLIDLAVDPATVLNEKMDIYQEALDKIMPN